MAEKVVVITRKYPLHGESVVSRIVKIPPPFGVDNVEHYEQSFAEDAMDDERKRIEEQFVEFRNAEWFYEVQQLHTR